MFLVRSVSLTVLVILFSLFSGLAFSSSDDKYVITFHDVGQGNGISVVSPSGQVLFIDAGSSSTRGVVGIGDDDGKYKTLAATIVGTVKDSLVRSRWLGFIVTHADKDHLNLISSIIEYSGLLGTGRIGVLFGGKETMYKGEGGDLLSFLKDHGIPYYFASAVYELEANTPERPGLFYVPQSGCPADMILRHWEGTRNVRVISIDATPVSGRRRVKEDSNAYAV